MPNHRRLLPLIAFLLLLPAQAPAQVPTPGTVQETLKPPVAPPREAPLPEIKTPPPAKPAAPADERRVKVERFAISGNTLFSEDELRKVIASWEGKELTLTDIYQVADQLTDFYQEHGYSLTTVTVPAQKMQAGAIRLEVVEGRVGKFIFNGNQRYRDQFLTRQLDQVKPGTIVKFKDLEREILLLNDLPGLVARSVLEPGEAYGTTDLILNIEETRATAQATFDNHGPKVVGQWRAGADFNINNPFKFGDTLSLGYTHTESGLLRQGRISYGFPVHRSGTKLKLSYNRADYDVGGEFSALGIDGTSETARIEATQPLIKSRRTNLTWMVGGAHVKGQSDLSGIPLSDDEISYLETGLDFGQRHGDGAITTLSALFATNFRDNSNGDRNNALPPRLELKGGYEYPFRQNWSAALRGEAVLSTDPMPDSNMYSIGGPTSVRAFVSSRLRGDQGALASLELRRFIDLEKVDLQLRGFVDAGLVDSHATAGAPGDSESLTGAGLGLSAMFADYFTLEMLWAKPLDGKESGENRDSRFWFTLNAGF